MAFDYLHPSNRNAIIVSGFFVFIGAFFYVIFPPLQTAAGIYTLLALVSLVIYSLSEFQGTVVGINLEKFGFQFLAGLGIATLFILLKIFIPGFSIGIPFAPESVSTTVKAIIILGLAPFVEELFTRGALLGFINYVESSGRELTAGEFWVANSVQSLFFAGLHLLAYVLLWYSLPGGALATSIGAQSSAFIAALTFGLIAGWVDTRKGIKSLLPSIISHFVVNTLVFVSLTVVGLSIFPAISLALAANVILLFVQKKKYSIDLLKPTL